MSKIVEHSFKYNGVEYDYDTERDCDAHGCDDYCRCSKIVNRRVVKVDVYSIAQDIYDLYFDDSKSSIREGKINTVLFGTSKEINLYTIDRILRYFRIWKNDNWQIKTDSGYYGEEIGDVIIDDQVAVKIENEIQKALEIDELDNRVEYLLKLEYGYILPELKDYTYEIVNLNKSDIVFGSIDHYKKVSTRDLDHYNDKSYFNIRGVVISDGSKFKIIDGYHRLTATLNGEVRIIKGKKK